MATGLYTDERTFWHTMGLYAMVLPIGGWVQPTASAVGSDTPDSKRRILSLLQVSGLTRKLSLREGRCATMADVLRVHSAAYAERFKALSDANGGELGSLAFITKGGFEVACTSAGLAIAALDDVWSGQVRNAYALCRPAGHHALHDRGFGACLLANSAIAIEVLKSKYAIGRIAVVDWDVHHGNGTQATFYDRQDVLTISLHQDGCYPEGYGGVEDRGRGDGTGANINIPLPPGSGHETYLHAINEIVVPALNAYRPELIIVASGLDANGFDPSARMLLHSETYRIMTRRMMEAAGRLCGDRLVVIHEGGYSEAYVPFCGLAIVEELSGEQTEVVDPMLDFLKAQQPRPRVVNFFNGLVDEMAVHFGYARMSTRAASGVGPEAQRSA
jgi:acetoin utilization deacetylase AcuC-like enzyme